MNKVMIGLLAETPIHPGTGRSVGVVDLPVARESATDYPVLVSSSLKGALKDRAKTKGAGEIDRRFGVEDAAGDLLVSDGRLLLLPVRNLTGSYRWATCPHLIERYCRDLARAGLGPIPPVPKVERGKVLTSAEGDLFLEERQFSVAGPPDKALVEAMGALLLHDSCHERVGEQLAVLNDDDFAWFVRYGLSVQARNVLEEETKKSKNLWYEETLPPDTVMYALLIGRMAESLSVLDQLFPAEDPYCQTGGNETVGQGWFAVKVRRTAEGGDQ